MAGLRLTIMRQSMEDEKEIDIGIRAGSASGPGSEEGGLDQIRIDLSPHPADETTGRCFLTRRKRDSCGP
jgi:hypothetical protein